jgi:HPt (histidine-containing phosphotransfer) domain-containing protein
LGEDAGPIIAEMIDAFPAEAATQLAKMTPGVAAGELAKAAHRLRGSALNIGAAALCAVCAQAEAAANHGDAVAALAHRAGMVQETDRVLAVLPTLRAAG